MNSRSISRGTLCRLVTAAIVSSFCQITQNKCWSEAAHGVQVIWPNIQSLIRGCFQQQEKTLYKMEAER